MKSIMVIITITTIMTIQLWRLWQLWELPRQSSAAQAHLQGAAAAKVPACSFLLHVALRVVQMLALWGIVYSALPSVMQAWRGHCARGLACLRCSSWLFTSIRAAHPRYHWGAVRPTCKARPQATLPGAAVATLSEAYTIISISSYHQHII